MKIRFDFTVRVCPLATPLAIFAILAGCNSNPLDSSKPATIEYTISGGFAGINQQTSIDDRGFAELQHHSHRGEQTSHFQLPKNQLDRLRRSFDKADFFSLKDEYVPDQPGADGFRYSISYTVADKNKTVIVEDGANVPPKLERLLPKLHETNYAILSNANEATLFIGVQYTIRTWPFSGQLRLADNLYQNVPYTDTKLSRAIHNFFVTVFQNAEPTDHFLFWEDDCFYYIDVNTASLFLPFESNIGSYFYPGNKFSIQIWPHETGIELEQIPEDGVILEGDVLRQVRKLLEPNPPALISFVLGTLQDHSKAVYLILVSGRNPQAGG